MSSQKKKRTSRAKKPKLEDLSQTHGKVEEFKPTTLDQIWGDDGMSKYGTLKMAEYEKKIAEMDTSDLHNHAIAVGLIPVSDETLMRKRLKSQFQRHVNDYTTPVDNVNTEEISDEVKKILEEGR